MRQPADFHSVALLRTRKRGHLPDATDHRPLASGNVAGKRYACIGLLDSASFEVNQVERHASNSHYGVWKKNVRPRHHRQQTARTASVPRL